MVKQCARCNHMEPSSDLYNCELCGSELVDNGQLVDALAFWGKGDHSIIKYIVPIGLVAASGTLSAAFNTHLVLYAGIVTAAIYYTKFK